MKQHASRARLGLTLALLLFATAAVYWTGLNGPFLLDDRNNLSIIEAWLAGQSTLHDVVFSTTSSAFGRPLSMATLALSAHWGGYTPYAFKLGNLLLHLVCGLVAYALLSRIAARDAGLQRHARTIALVVSAAWLLHPLNASTVLYAVQRMAQLSTLAMLAGMWLFMALRTRVERDGDRRALAGILVGVPLVAGIGFLAKENAVLLLPLCLVLELGCFQGPRPRTISGFFALTCLLPLLAVVAMFAANPFGFLRGGYVSRDFDMSQRVLTQARALLDYLSKILLPDPGAMGVYTDDFGISTGLLSPPGTAVAIFALLAITVAAWRLRQRIPALFVGWGMFLLGHAIESSVLPLELYFEHRNYLPMLGVLYAVAGVAMALGRRFGLAGPRAHRVAAGVVVAVLALLAWGTHGRARTWGDEALLVESAVAAHPDSMRGQLAVVDAAVRLRQLPRAEAALDAMTRSGNAKMRAQGHLNRINLSCAMTHAGNADDLRRAVADASPRINQDEAETFALLLANTTQPCVGISNEALADAAAAFAGRATSQPDAFGPKARLRHTAAAFLARDGQWAKVLPQARLAWQPGMPAAASVLLVQAQLASGDLAGAERTHGEAMARIDPSNPQDAAGLRWLRGQIDAKRQQVSAGTPPVR